MRRDTNTDLLVAALMGYQTQYEDIKAKIEEIKAKLTGRAKARGHKISAEGRARIAAAQRRRWAEKKRK